MIKRIAIYGSGVFVTIKPEDQYCSEDCSYYINPPKCILFEKKLELCLGGGPLRCAACVRAEKQTKEVN